MSDGGVDPMYLARGTTLQTEYAFGSLVRVVFILLFFMNFL